MRRTWRYRLDFLRGPPYGPRPVPPQQRQRPQEIDRWPSEYEIDNDADRGELKQRLDETIEDLAGGIQKLSESLGEQMSYLKNRHRLLAEMERLQGDYSVPIKLLEKRLALLKPGGKTHTASSAWPKRR